MRSLFLQTRIPYRVLRKIDSVKDIDEPSIWVIDVDTMSNRDFIDSVKNNENTLKLYLSSINVENAGINFPKFDIIDSEITSSKAFEMIRDNTGLYNAIMEERNNKPEVKPKEEAIKTMPSIESKMVSTEENDEDEDDMLVAPKKVNRVIIKKHDTIYEDEDEDNDNDSYISVEEERSDKPSAKISDAKIEAAKLEEQTIKSEVSENIKQEHIEPIEPVKKVLYDNNERADRDLKESDYVDNLGLFTESEFRCPIIVDKPIEYISTDISNAVDSALSKYRVRKLVKAGLDKFQVISEITKMRKEEEKVRMESLKEREIKRQEFLKKFDDSKIDVSKVRAKENIKDDGGAKLRSSLGLSSATQAGKPTLIENSDIVMGSGEKAAKKLDMEAAPPKPKEKMKSRDEIMEEIERKKKDAKERRLMMDTGAESIEELQKKRREEIRKNAERKVLQSDKPGLPDLPVQKLTDRNQMAALYKDENIKRAESRTELKTSVKKPKDVVIEVDDDDMIDTKKKKGFFGFGKK